MIAKRIVLSLVLPLVLTLLLEAVFGFVLGARNLRNQGIIALTNLLTNPPLNLILLLVSLYLSPKLYYYILLPFEAIVVVVEGAIYKNTMETKLNPFLFSLILNFCSYFIGKILLLPIHNLIGG